MANGSNSNGKKLEEYSKEELIEAVKDLRKRKKFGLVWEAKPEDVVEQCKQELPVLEQVSERSIVKSAEQPTNLIIEGDNYHALSVLNYTHAGKIDFIYIDPPYNTGNNSWKYNNKYVDENDTFRHSKWVAMMFARLTLARNLLNEDGIVCVAIDNYELHNLRHILEQIFPDREIITTVIEHNHRGRAKNNFALTHEYALWVVKKGIESITRKEEISEEIKRNLRRTGQGSRRRESPSLFYGIEVDIKSGRIVSVTDPIPEGKRMPKTKSDRTTYVFPIDGNGVERRWYYGRKTVMAEAAAGRVWAKVLRGKYEVHYRKAGNPIRRKSLWAGSKYDGSTHGTELLTAIIGEHNFPFPKSLYAVMECIEAATSKKDAVILDFFAGSGTTGHACLMLNKKDGDLGKRSFILCTNNEGNIADEITWPRIKKTVEGVRSLPDLTKIPANVRYFRTAFVPRDDVSDDTRRNLVARSTEMICVRENTFDKKYDNKGYKIYSDGKIVTGILFDLDSQTEFKKKLATLMLPAHLYVFSLSNDVFADDFSDLPVKHKLCPIPESILEVYRKIFA